MLQFQIEPKVDISAEKADPLSPPAFYQQPASFITAQGTEMCVVCHADTGVRVTEPVEQRNNYVSGIGQCCDTCSPGW